MHDILQPPGWPRPKGYANGVAASGRLVATAGIVGWDTQGRFAPGFVEQVHQLLENTLAVLAEGGAGPEHIIRMTWYVLSRAEYLAHAREVGEIYRALLGRHFPAMAVVEVSGLMEADAKLEIETLAVIPD
jgi:enamine deaminase RidA (YjgF/YER057c/UK114 family)